MTLSVGVNIAYIKVTAEDRMTAKVYKLTVTREAPEDPYTPVISANPSEETSKTVHITLNGQEVTATINEDGVLELTYTADDIAKYTDDTGVYNVSINGVEDILIVLPISALKTDDLTVSTDFGLITIPNSTLKALMEEYGDTLKLSIKKGSFKVALLDEDGKEISYDDPSNPFTITLPYTLGSGQKSGAVVALDRDGSVMPYAVYKNGLVSLEVSATGTYNVIYNKKSFTDVGSHWAEDYIDFVAARALYAGVGNDRFDPNGAMTRAMFASVLANLEGADLSGYVTSRFSDVPDGQWYTAAVEWAADKGIVTGVGDGRFSPNSNISREQMAVMLNNYIKYKGYSLKPVSTATAFNDSGSISTWAADAVGGMQTAGIISGRPGNLFDPKGNATRAEVATVFARFVENLTV